MPLSDQRLLPRATLAPLYANARVASVATMLRGCRWRRYSPVVNSGHTYPRNVALSPGAKGNGFPPAPFAVGTRAHREGQAGKWPSRCMRRVSRCNPGHAGTFFSLSAVIGQVGPSRFQMKI